jgi:hypothetical protein
LYVIFSLFKNITKESNRSEKKLHNFINFISSFNLSPIQFLSFSLIRQVLQ